ncbi:MULTISPECIES: MarR family winged helix-turn-helix transcriptional regulator [Pseudomonas]|uniref:MarR family transcriptional regulator n=3 Tax=Pseudomonas TaxID=286 RepID=A0AAE2A9U6_PSEFL|nr:MULTISPECIES: MarR family transcriptional regulator [Pseudomonas]NKF26648.1 MarR family transcriptional regulator [Pseudomonas sp. BG5]ABA75383.1 putative transcriptional regulator (MarR family) [Pseudomonas fluorescens Pf0-1]AMQ83750.1 MarR family transcriptional regulator [Pseudomonas glycinae]ANI55429.1 MarR family transcriptional regulator [Pseudomonas sp. DR 5-09]AWA40338.1 MarR family transcriptional regulator [Pseudomonas fluorescens]
MKHFTPDEFQHCHLGLLLGRAALLKDKIIDTHMEPHGITAAQFKVLIIMAQFGVDTPAELCRHLSLDSGSMTRMLDRLEQKGFLVRQRSEGDRRQVQLKLTEQGQQLADRLPHIGADAMNELAGAVTPDELKTLEYILKKILLAAGDPITIQRLGEHNER